MDPQLALLISGIVFLTCIVLVVVLILRPSDTAEEETRLGQLSNSSRIHSASTPLGKLSDSGRHSDSRRGKNRPAVGERMIQAGLYRRHSMGFYVATKVVLGLVPIVIAMAVGFVGLLTLPAAFIIGVTLSVVGLMVPSFWLDSKKRQRQRQLTRALPDGLDVIVVCLEAGLSLRASIARVSKELRSAHPMLAAELIIVDREIQLGHSAGDALGSLATRFDLEQLRGLASVVMQAEKYGVSVAGSLRVHAEDLRIKRFQKAEELAQKASVKLLFPTLFLIFPTLYVVLLGPAVFELMTFFEQFNGPAVGQ